MAPAPSRPGERVEGQLEARTTTDRVLLRAFLERDRLYAAYAICDLDAREFARTRWGAAFDGDRLPPGAPPHAGPPARLPPAEIGALNRLYTLGFTSWLPAEAVAQGVYYGIRVGGRP